MSNFSGQRAYSYIRFSTPDQIKGDSFRRQFSMAQSFAAKNGLILDESLSLRDLGVSAYRGQNAKTGALNLFLEHVKSKDVPRGSLLLIEALDRFSRQPPLDALDSLREIMREGITVVTLDNERAYTHESIQLDVGNLILTLMLFSRANEESETKSRRLKMAWDGKRQKAATVPLTAICPAWLRLSLDRTQYEVISERAHIVQSIYTMFLDGFGQHAIAAKLNASGTPTFGRALGWQRSYVKKVLENPAVIGHFTPHTLDVVVGRKVRTPHAPLKNYYPAIVEVETFEKVALMSSGRGGGQSKYAEAPAPMANILSGLAKCPACGSTMTRVNKGARKGSKPYLVCTKAKVGAGCAYRQVKLEVIESAIMSMGTYLHSLTPSPNAEFESRYRAALVAAEVVEDELQHLVTSIARGLSSKAVLRAIPKKELELDTLRHEVSELAELAAASMTNRVDNAVEEFRRLTTAAQDSLDVAKINATMRQLFDRVVVDYEVGYLRLHWRHTEQSSADVLYAFV